MADETIPGEALKAAREARYGEPVDTYTWDLVADAVLTVAAPLIAAAEGERIAQLADRVQAISTSDEGTTCFFSALIRGGAS